MSREMDALVAEKVMGWTMSERLGYGLPIASSVPPVKCPEYTSDVADDYRVLQHVRENWEFAARFRMGQMLWAMWDLRGHTELAYEPGDFSLAALAALGVKEPA